MAIFNSYVKLPEGKTNICSHQTRPCLHESIGSAGQHLPPPERGWTDFPTCPTEKAWTMGTMEVVTVVNIGGKGITTRLTWVNWVIIITSSHFDKNAQGWKNKQYQKLPFCRLDWINWFLSPLSLSQQNSTMGIVLPNLMVDHHCLPNKCHILVHPPLSNEPTYTQIILRFLYHHPDYIQIPMKIYERLGVVTCYNML